MPVFKGTFLWLMPLCKNKHRFDESNSAGVVFRKQRCRRRFLKAKVADPIGEKLQIIQFLSNLQAFLLKSPKFSSNCSQLRAINSETCLRTFRAIAFLSELEIDKISNCPINTNFPRFKPKIIQSK